MPQYRQGDIFKISRNESYELAVVFGHIGFNLMAGYWRDFAQDVQDWVAVSHPFSALAGRPHQYRPGHWIWFIPEKQNHGMTDIQVKQALDQALMWAKQNVLGRVITNGISDIDHGYDTEANRASDDSRARVLSQLVSDRERELNLQITLVGLNDVFTRNFP